MLIIGNNVFSIGGYGTIYKLVVIGIFCYQSKMDINLLIDGGTKSCDSLNYVMCYLTV